MGDTFAGFVDACGNNYVPLGFNKCKRAAVLAGQNSVCERRYNELQVCPEHNDLIEKMVSEQTVK